MKGFYTILLLSISNVFMTVAWYGHLKLKDMNLLKEPALLTIILVSWGIAFFEYLFMVPANRIGYKTNGGSFSLVELKTLQEVISLSVFVIMTTLLFRNEKLAWNHIAGFICLVLAVIFVFRKWN